ncbi:PREDICTED: cullin-9-like, partial [Charadrius vociferus]|uniref:cullin-9-like n=1 Tax=Charadrius vociferus TaxID=50402 RepID=UPI00052180E4
MVNERHNGNLLVHLGPKLQAYPGELLRQRRGHDGQPEYLIQWSIVSLEEKAAGGNSASSAETKPENISMWMSAEEVCASCPALLGKRKLEGQWVKEEKAASPFAADVPLDEASLLEMKADVRSLVQRAGRQMAETGIPGKLLFVLVKRYLCVTSLMDKLSSGMEQGGEQQDCPVPGPFTEERSRVKQEFEFSMAMANLILELVHVMGWDHSHKPELLPQQELRPRTTRSIFQHRATSCTATQAAPTPPPKEPSIFKTRSAFPSRSSYVEYVQANLVRGMRVRMLEDYEQVSAGDEGDFRQSNDGTPPVQVYWQALGCTYWVHWHMVEIIGPSGQEEHEGQEKVSTLTYSHKLAAGEQPPTKAAETLSRAEWWRRLFFVKKLEVQEQEEITCLIQQDLGEQ